MFVKIGREYFNVNQIVSFTLYPAQKLIMLTYACCNHEGDLAYSEENLKTEEEYLSAEKKLLSL